MHRLVLALLLLPFLASAVPAQDGTGVVLPVLENSDYKWIASRVAENETGGQARYLTYWGAGEDFPSFGIGHFIWFPAGVDAPFDETFPALVRFLGEQPDIPDMPQWLRDLAPFDAPWPNKATFDEALIGLKAALEKGDDPDLLWQLAEVYGTHLGLTSKAEAVRQRFAAAYPDDPRVKRVAVEPESARVPVEPAEPSADAPSVERTAKELWTRALAAHRQGDTARAMVLYKAAVDNDPSLFGAWHNLGLAAKTEGDLEVAQHAFEQALTLREGWPDSLFMLAVVLHVRGDDDAATELLDRVLVKETNHV